MDRLNTSLVSVIVPVYKAEPYLRDCLDSILAQTYANLEIILVDDGSPDGCPAICDEYALCDDRIRVIHKANTGVSDSRNAALDLANGEWVTFVDSDDLVSPYMIEAMLTACRGENDVCAVGFNRFADGKKPVHSSPECSVRSYTDIRSFTKCRGGMFACGILYNRGRIEAVKLRFAPSLRNLEDTAWNSIYLAFAEQMHFLPDRMYDYRQNPASATSRCADKHWQVGSWFRARNIIFTWFSLRNRTAEAANALRIAYRYCANNIFAECTVGKLTYPDYSALRITPPSAGVLIPELVLENLFPRLYFTAYMAMMRLRNLIRR